MIDALERAIVQKLQGDLPLVQEPYKKIAEELGITETALLDKIKNMREKKILRRIGGILYHRTVGFSANAMVVWRIPAEHIEEAAKVMTSFSQVSHCYERETFEGWPYNIYTMVHAQSYELCETVILEMSKLLHLDEYEVLYSTRELKKSSMKYFVDSK